VALPPLKRIKITQNMAIKGLIFDLDGTVTLSQQFHAKAFGIVFKRLGLTYTAADDARYSGRGAHCTFPEFFQEHGIELTPEQIEEYCKEKRGIYNELIRNSKIEPVPGIKKFLERQRDKGMLIAIATGNRIEAAMELLRRAGVEKYFQVIVTNQHVAKSKPAPDIFLKAAEKLDLQPEECIVFEDAANGVYAAKAAEIRCIALNTTTPKEKLLAAGAERIVDSYDEVTDDVLSPRGEGGSV